MMARCELHNNRLLRRLPFPVSRRVELPKLSASVYGAPDDTSWPVCVLDTSVSGQPEMPRPFRTHGLGTLFEDPTCMASAC